MKDQTFQIQRILADELDAYRGRENSYVNNNIQEIQKLYKDKEQKKKEGTIEDKKVILIKPYEISGLALSTIKLSFINNEVNNLLKYMKFIQSSIQTRKFWLLPHYQSLQSRGEQDPEFWKEVATAFINNKHNTKTSQNGYSITMFQEELLYEPYFIAINKWGQVIIGLNKKMVATYVVGKLEMLV